MFTHSVNLRLYYRPQGSSWLQQLLETSTCRLLNLKCNAQCFPLTLSADKDVILCDKADFGDTCGDVDNSFLTFMLWQAVSIASLIT